MVATLAVDGSAIWVDKQAARHGLLANALVQLQLRLEGSLVTTIGHQLDGLEQSATAYVANVRVADKALDETPPQQRAHLLNVLQQAIAMDHLLDSQRSSA